MPVLECSRCNELYYSAHGSTELSCDACGGGAWRVFEDEVSLARVAGLPRVAQPGDHGVLVYTEEHDAAEFCVRYLEEGIARGERLIVALPEELRGEVIGRLGPAAMENAVVLESERLYGPDFDPEATAREFDADGQAGRRSGAHRVRPERRRGRGHRPGQPSGATSASPTSWCSTSTPPRSASTTAAACRSRSHPWPWRATR